MGIESVWWELAVWTEILVAYIGFGDRSTISTEIHVCSTGILTLTRYLVKIVNNHIFQANLIYIRQGFS